MEFRPYFCPICRREYTKNPTNCECGFSGIQYRYDNDELIFRIYKYAKDVFYGKREYAKSELYTDSFETYDMIIDFASKRGVEYIVAPTENETHVSGGVAALNRKTHSLIIDADVVDSEFLDESIVTSVFFGKRFKRIEDGYLKKNGLKYITVHPDNEYFSSDGNLLFDKSRSILIAYPPKRTEEEYRVPDSVKVIGRYAFKFASNLKRIYVPKHVRLEKDCIYPKDSIEIIYC